MKKTSMLFAVVMLVSGLAGCADKYADYRDVLKDESAVVGDFLAEARQAVDAEALRAEIEKLDGGLQDLAAKLNKVEQDHPELSDLSAVPPELKAEMEKLQQSIAGLDQLLLDKEKLFSDPKVEKALEELLDLRGSLGL
jgi:prefoldin subunit 5